MNLNEFLERLRETPRCWKLTSGKYIRLRMADRSHVWTACPITSMGSRELYSSCHYRSVAEELGMERELRDQIVAAADMLPEHGYDHKLRAKLLEACGLEER